MKRNKGIALITALFVVLILFAMASTLFFFGGRTVQLSSRSYEQAVARYCGLAGLEYADSLIRRGVVFPFAREDLTNHPERMELVISDLAFDSNGQKFIGGVGVFRLTITYYAGVALGISGYNYYLIRSRGQIFRSLADAQANRFPLEQKTYWMRFIPLSAQLNYPYNQRGPSSDYYYEQWR